MGVPGQQEVGAVLGEVVQDALVRGVDDGDPEVRFGVLALGAAGPAGVPFKAQVRIVDAGEVKRRPLTTRDWQRLVRSTQPPMPKPERSRGQSSLVGPLGLEEGPRKYDAGFFSRGAK